jgi:hypothetical protein
VWQRTTTGANAVFGTFDSFAYGVETPDPNLPRTGQARYAVDLLGAGAHTQDVTALSGTGNLMVNFGTSTLTGMGNAQEISAVTGQLAGAGEWTMTANLAAAANNFEGEFAYGGATGPITGRFYGPQAQEVGAAFAASGTEMQGPVSFSGFLLGRRVLDSDTSLNASLTDLRFDQRFLGASSGLFYQVDAASGAPDESAPVERYGAGVGLHYSGADGSYQIINGSSETLASFGSAQIVEAESSNRYTVYASGTGSSTDKLILYRPGTGNDELALTYASFGSYERVRPAEFAAGRNTVQKSWFAYGLLTPSSGLPRSGHGNYNAIIRGVGLTGTASTPELALEGSAVFNFDFQSMFFTGYMRPIGIEPNGTRHDLGQYDFHWGQVRPDDVYPSFSARFLLNGQELLDGGLTGFFAGPAAEEIGGSFSGRFIPPGSNAFSGYWAGAFVGKKTP